MYAQAHPEMLDGIVAIAPYLGEPELHAEIARSGGLMRWEAVSPGAPAESAPSSQAPRSLSASRRAGAGSLTGDKTDELYLRKLWVWLRGYGEHGGDRPPLWLGWGTQDSFAKPCRLLAEALPLGQAVARRSDHSWSTWLPLMTELRRRAWP